jgi:hypothetical protein
MIGDSGGCQISRPDLNTHMSSLTRALSLTKSKIEAFVDDEQEEDVLLEFKTVSSSDMKNKDDKKSFAKALSGFANSSGGLIVWGIDARKNVRGIDSASALKPVDDVSLFLTKLNEFEGQFVSPVVDGVRHKKIETTGTKGYAVTLVPESYGTPHMAKGGEDRYYKRSGDSFYRMEHFDLEDMFGRRKKPKLILQARCKRRTSATVDVILGLKNVGRGAAKYPYVTIGVKRPYSISREEFNYDVRPTLRPLAFGQEYGKEFVSGKFGANADIVIHSDSVCDFARIDITHAGPRAGENLVIHYEATAEDVRSETGKLVVDCVEMIQLKLGEQARVVFGSSGDR